jgi:hypothetical protein
MMCGGKSNEIDASVEVQALLNQVKQLIVLNYKVRFDTDQIFVESLIKRSKHK